VKGRVGGVNTHALLVSFVCLVPFSSDVLTGQERPQPNILFLLADDLGYGDLGCYKSPVNKTPNLDRLASQGVRLLECYAASPNCSPARAGILTGRSPYRVGMYDFVRFKEMHIPASEHTIPELLRTAGYQTMFAGKWHCSGRFRDPTQPGPGEHGFDHWFAHERNFGQDPSGFVRNGKVLPKLKGWMSELVVNETITWLGKRDKSKPFCAFLWFSEPHTPVVAAEEFYDLYRKDSTDGAAKKLKFGGAQVKRNKAKDKQRHKYFGCVSMLDHHIGRLLTKLDELNLTENTIVVFTSDNGPEHRTATAFGSPGHLRGAKGHMHDGGIHVPGIIRWPGKVRAGTTSSVPVNGTDYLPSFCAVAGAKIPADRTLDGANVMPGIVSGEQVTRKRAMMWWLFHARGGKQVAMRDGDYKMLAHMSPQANAGSIADAKPPKGWSKMKFIKEARLDGFTMYDLTKDPSESHDLSAEQPERFVKLKKRMIELHREIQAEGPVIELGRR
jgi:arylsulfatase A